MQKTTIIDFTKGLNLRQPLNVFGAGHALVMDGVDMSSGIPQSFKMPGFFKGMDASTRRVWEYRGHWFESETWKDYAAQFVGLEERIFYTEEGRSPRKVVNGVDAPLGTIVPTAAPTVATGATDLIPNNITVTQITSGGDLPKGKASYRISAVTEDGIMPPSEAITVEAADKNYQNKLEWGPVSGAKSYLVWGRNQDEERRMIQLPSSVLTWTDNGTVSPSGEFAKSYDEANAVFYAYAFVRMVGGMRDEGGLSLPSAENTTSRGRLVTRDFLNDGFYDQEGALKALDGVTFNMAAAATADQDAIQISSAVRNSDANAVIFTATGAHGLVTDAVVAFSGAAWASDPNYNGKSFTIVKVDSTRFAIKDVPLPSGITYGGTSTVTNAISIVTITAIGGSPDLTDETSVQTDDAVYLTLSGSAGIFRATKIDNYSFSIKKFLLSGPVSTDIYWVPKNGFIRYWRLYRSAPAGQFQLDKEVDIWDTSVSDAKHSSKLGDTPSGFYQDGRGIQVSYSPPPVGLRGIIEHYGMLAGIHENTVQITPVGRPDAWPEVYKFRFESTPIALKSYGGGITVLLQDGIVRLDGFSEDQLTPYKTQAKDGCIAPRSVQEVQGALYFLGSRGLIRFDGTATECFTEQTIPPEFFLGESAYRRARQYAPAAAPTATVYSTAKPASKLPAGDYTYATVFVDDEENESLASEASSTVTIDGTHWAQVVIAPTTFPVSNGTRARLFRSFGGGWQRLLRDFDAIAGATYLDDGLGIWLYEDLPSGSDFGEATDGTGRYGDNGENFCLIPTARGFFYNRARAKEGADVRAGLQSFRATAAHFGVTKDIGSFVWRGKFFLFYPSKENFEAHTMVYVDLERPGAPVQTLPFKILDAHVTKEGEAYFLIPVDEETPGGILHENIGATHRPYTSITYGADGLIYATTGTGIYQVDPSDGSSVLFAGDASTMDHVDDTGTAARFLAITATEWGSDGNLYIAEASGGYVRKMTPAGVVTTLATVTGMGTINLRGIALDPNSTDIYVSDYDSQVIWKVGGLVSVFAGTEGGSGHVDATGTGAQFNGPSGIAFDSTGANLLVCDYSNNCIRSIVLATAVVSTVAGSTGTTSGTADGTGTAARFHGPTNLLLNTDGTFFISDYTNKLYRTFDPVSAAVGTLVAASGNPSRMGLVSKDFFYAQEFFSSEVSYNAIFKVKRQGATRELTNFFYNLGQYETRALRGRSPLHLRAKEVTGMALFHFNPTAGTDLPMLLATGPMVAKSLTQRKGFEAVEVTGRGTWELTVYVDGRFCSRARVVATASPDHSRKLRIPTGTKGYTVEVEARGTGVLTAMELTYDDLARPS